MEFPGSFTEQASGGTVGANDLLSQSRGFLLRKLNQRLFGKRGISQIWVAAQDVFKVTVEAVQSIALGISFVYYQHLEDR